MLKNVELRKLPPGSLYSIIHILETNNDWKKVISLIPKNPQSDVFEPKYNMEHIRLIEEHSKATGIPCAESLFQEWSTSGKIRPTLSTLKDIVIQAQIYRAADEIALMMQEALPQRPKDGPAAPITENLTQLLEEQTTKLNDTDTGRPIGNRTTVQIKSATNLINITTEIDSAELPDVSALQAISDKTTKQLKSASDLIKFSEKQYTEGSIDSSNMPKFSEIMPDSQWNDNASYSSNSDTESSLPLTEQRTESTEINKTRSSTRLDTSILQDTSLIQFKYRTLEKITNRFADTLTTGPNGLVGKIGSGGFGEVFVGFHPTYGCLAVKKAHAFLPFDNKLKIVMKAFNREIKYLHQFKHKNIVPILGFCRDGPVTCIVCEYLEGGSLEQKLSEKVLSEEQRINVMWGTAEGLQYLHGGGDNSKSDIDNECPSSQKSNFVHGDIKSANILLTKEFIPKLCDFGLTKPLDNTYKTTLPMGTSAYMAPEGFSGTITQKIDIYSFGIVLLELLTGLKPIVNTETEKINIKDYVEDCDNINKLLDPVTQWTKSNEIYNLAIKCLVKDRKSRPSIDELCAILKNTIL